LKNNIEFVSVGKILNFHGIRGEAKVGFSDKDFLPEKVYAGDEHELLEITQIRLNKKFAIVKFKGINSIDELLPYKGMLIFAEKQSVQEMLQEDEFLIGDLTGLQVTDEDGAALGFVSGVSNNGAVDLLSVKTKSGKISLVPFVKAIVTDVSLKDKRVTINKIEGLIE
jgi:16S rRNA processing protein RimM